MSDTTPFDPKEHIEQAFHDAGIPLDSVDVRAYPEETIYVVRVAANFKPQASQTANEIDQVFSNHGVKGFVTVREAEAPGAVASSLFNGDQVASEVVTQFMNLLSERARTSEIRPSLSYLPDTAANISRATTARHHLVFGRRGAGKTSLLLEAKRIVEAQGHLTVWVNVQTYRLESGRRAFLWLSRAICDAVTRSLQSHHAEPRVVSMTEQLRAEIDSMVAGSEPQGARFTRLIPGLQSIIRRFVDSSGVRLYVFLDDFHYLRKVDQPLVLDLLHGAVRDCDAWIKVSAIKHLSRWFQSNPPLGLQTGHDADHIDLDVTLQDPSKAKQFLDQVLKTYANEAGIRALSKVISAAALDRLVLASGAVPRDYLMLCAGAIAQARLREGARTVGQQDVNKAAGIAAKAKIIELEEDLAGSAGSASPIIEALNIVRAFCLDERKCTYFRIDFKDKEKRPAQYSILQSLMDVRLAHLVNPSVSDEHHAGEKSEVYMLDLSQFSGHRLKKNLKVLDFSAGHIVLSETGTKRVPKVGDTANKLLAILRRGPLFELSKITVAGNGAEKGEWKKATAVVPTV